MLLEGLPGYIENNCNEKLLTIQEFKEKLHSFLINEYNQTNHSSIKVSPIKNGVSIYFYRICLIV